MTTKAAKSTKGAVMDVSKPGKTNTPSIVMHPTIHETSGPTEPEATTTSEEPTTAPLLTPVKKVVIQPLHDHIEAEKQESPAAPVQPSEAPTVSEDTVAVETTTNDEKVTTEPAAAPTPETPIEKPVPAAAPVKTTAPPEEASPASDDEAERARREHQQQIQKLVENQRYFLPIQTVKQRASRRALLIGLPLIIILAVAWYDVALDAGLLTNSYNLPHTSFFTVKQ
jgi:hypothetical protein